MNLVVYENNKPYVIDEFQAGRFDYIELASDVAETRFFEFLFSKEIITQLVEHYPSPRWDVVRFSNEEVLDDVEAVAMAIANRLCVEPKFRGGKP